MTVDEGAPLPGRAEDPRVADEPEQRIHIGLTTSEEQ